MLLRILAVMRRDETRCQMHTSVQGADFLHFEVFVIKVIPEFAISW